MSTVEKWSGKTFQQQLKEAEVLCQKMEENKKKQEYLTNMINDFKDKFRTFVINRAVGLKWNNTQFSEFNKRYLLDGVLATYANYWIEMKKNFSEIFDEINSIDIDTYKCPYQKDNSGFDLSMISF
jgi:hypothetical protein